MMADDFDDVMENVKKGATWLRVIHLIGYCIVLNLVMVVSWVLVAAQALFSIFTGSDNRNLRLLGSSLAQYASEILNFVTYNSDDKPFPFKPFPVGVEQDFTAEEGMRQADVDIVSAQNSEPSPGQEFDDLTFLSVSGETERKAGTPEAAEKSGAYSDHDQRLSEAQENLNDIDTSEKTEKRNPAVDE